MYIYIYSSLVCKIFFFVFTSPRKSKILQRFEKIRSLLSVRSERDGTGPGHHLEMWISLKWILPPPSLPPWARPGRVRGPYMVMDWSWVMSPTGTCGDLNRWCHRPLLPTTTAAHHPLIHWDPRRLANALLIQIATNSSINL